MNITLLHALLLGLLALVAYCNSCFGSININRPIVTSLFVGLIFGNVPQALIIGATLELVFMGAMAVGASNPPDIVSGGILGTAFALSTGFNTATAVALAVPIATLILMLQNLVYSLVISLFVHKGDQYAKEGNIKGVEAMHFAGIAVSAVPFAILVGIAFYLGSPVIEYVLKSIPKFVTNGMTIATGILPALGFALLTKMIMNKKVLPFFILGFLVASYAGISIIGIALFGSLIAYLMVMNEQKQKEEVLADDNEF